MSMEHNLLPDFLVQKAKSDIVGVVGRYVKLDKHGKEYKGLCPFHNEKTPSFSVIPDKNAYYCFGCGSGGDAIDFVIDFEDIPFREAIFKITGGMAPGEQKMEPRQSVRKEQEEEWLPIVPVPAEGLKVRPMDTINRKIDGVWQSFTAAKLWAYTDLEGRLIGHVARFDLPGWRKDVIPLSYCLNSKTGEMRWRWRSFGKPRPLYGAAKLKQHPNALVILVEGEKAADAGQARYEAAGIPRDKLIVLSWPGGCKSIPFVDWTPLSGRVVVLWPDADRHRYPDRHPLAGQEMPLLLQPGTVAMLDVAKLLPELAKPVKIITPPAGATDGWDLADPPPEGFSLLAHTKAAALVLDDFLAQHRPAEAAPSVGPDADPVLVGEAEEGDKSIQTTCTGPDHSGHFAIRGYGPDGIIYIYLDKRQQLLATTSSKLCKISGLIELAPLDWWEGYFQKAGGKGLDAGAAANWVLRVAEGSGVYDHTRVRGRGVWLDEGRLIFHHGNYLTVDGRRMALSQIASSYVYEVRTALRAPACVPLTDAEGAGLLGTASRFRWAHRGAGELMVGWTFLASVCGGLKWRPHIWISAGAGAGKSTLLERFLRPLLPDAWPLYLMGTSSEAGVRQKLDSDARPVLIDEFETNSKEDAKRIENILTLIRQSSSESGAEVARGTVSGQAMSFNIRSAFCLSSVGVNLHRQTDEDRITRLEMRSDMDNDWEALEAELCAISQDKTIAQRLFARALLMLPTIRATADVFTRVASRHFGRQRDGDQYGTLLAGCWCLQKNDVPSEVEAVTLIKAYDWVGLGAGAALLRDEAREALDTILSANIRIDNSRTMSVSQLLEVVSCSPNAAHGAFEVTTQEADQTLQLHGIRLGEGESPRCVMFAMGYRSLIGLVENTDFSTDLMGRLARLPNARKSRDDQKKGKVRFAGTAKRYVSVPLSLCTGSDADGARNSPPI